MVTQIWSKAEGTCWTRSLATAVPSVRGGRRSGGSALDGASAASQQLTHVATSSFHHRGVLGGPSPTRGCYELAHAFDLSTAVDDFVDGISPGGVCAELDLIRGAGLDQE